MLKLFRSSRESETATELDSLDLSIDRSEDGATRGTNTAVMFGRSIAEEKRRYERELILKYDTRELKRGEAWFIVEASWLDEWMTFVLSEDDPDCPVSKPGPLSNHSLFDPREYCIKKNLSATVDYRGVNPQVYALYRELYGTGGAKPIARWTLDVYATPVMIDDVNEMLRGPELQARVEVAKMLEKFALQEDDSKADNDPQPSLMYRCCCECEYLAPFLAMLFYGPTYADGSPRKSAKRKWRRRRKKRTYGDESESDSEEESETAGLLG